MYSPKAIYSDSNCLQQEGGQARPSYFWERCCLGEMEEIYFSDTSNIWQLLLCWIWATTKHSKLQEKDSSLKEKYQLQVSIATVSPWTTFQTPGLNPFIENLQCAEDRFNASVADFECCPAAAAAGEWSFTDMKCVPLWVGLRNIQIDSYFPIPCQESGNLYFCFRWLLIWFKREFSFPDTCTLWEALWTKMWVS